MPRNARPPCPSAAPAFGHAQLVSLWLFAAWALAVGALALYGFLRV